VTPRGSSELVKGGLPNLYVISLHESNMTVLLNKMKLSIKKFNLRHDFIQYVVGVPLSAKGSLAWGKKIIIS